MPRGRPLLASPPPALADAVTPPALADAIGLLAFADDAAASSPAFPDATAPPRPSAPAPTPEPTSSSPADLRAPYPKYGLGLSAEALRDPSYLPVQIGGIVAAYGISLVVVALTLLSLVKRRRDRLLAGHNNAALGPPANPYGPENPPAALDGLSDGQMSARVPNFSYPSPVKTEFAAAPTPYIYPSPASAVTFPGVDPSVDQSVVQADREMAQRQLEHMYRHVMDHEDAKRRDLVLESPVSPGPAVSRHAPASSTPSKNKARTKPASLSLGSAREDKTQSRASSFFSALRSPRKKSVRGVSISSPIMAPQSSTFLDDDLQEMEAMTPRPYAPPPPRPSAADQQPVSPGSRTTCRGVVPLTRAPQSVQGIDERISQQLNPPGSTRYVSQAPTEVSLERAVPLVGLPSSPRPGAKSPLLPSSPRPGASFPRPNAPSAVRTGGSLPLRAYEPAMDSPSATARTIKQTVLERAAPPSPTTGLRPQTAGPVPYTPYQPHTPCIPVTPSLITKEDRKRMKRTVPKTPTLEMVKSEDDIW